MKIIKEDIEDDVVKDALISYLQDEADTDELVYLVRDLNTYSDALEGLEWYDFDIDEFFEEHYSDDVTGAVRAVLFGKVNSNDEYVRFNGYGNLETANEQEVLSLLRGYAEEMADAILDLEDRETLSFSLGINDILSRNDFELSVDDEEYDLIQDEE